MSHEDCPICSTPLKEYIDTIDWGGPIAEHYAACPNKCYSYEYAYGYTTVLVGDKQFGWTYSTDKETLQAEQAAVDAAIETARENQTQRSEKQS
jgi:hypothetical protein